MFPLENIVKGTLKSGAGRSLLLMGVMGISYLISGCGANPISTSTPTPTNTRPPATATFSPSPTAQRPVPSTPEATEEPYNIPTPESVYTPTPEPTPAPTYTPEPTPPPTPTLKPTPVPLPDLQIANIKADFSQVNGDGTTSYNLTVTGNYGLTKPDKAFNIGILGLEGIIGSNHPATIKNDGTFSLVIPVVRLPDKGSPAHRIFAIADIGNVIEEQNEGNNKSGAFELKVNEPPITTRQAWEYCQEICFGGETDNIKEITKWRDPIRVYVRGEPTKEHLNELDKTLDDLHKNGYDVQYVNNPDEANFTYYLNVDRKFYDNILRPYVSKEFLDKNAGVAAPFFEGHVIKKGIAAVAKNSIHGFDYPPDFIKHLIREEATQLVTGIRNDSYRYKGSIFYEDSSDMPLTFLPIDEEVIRLMASNVIKSGMTMEQVRNVIRVVDTPLKY